jgi:hypothetical protein
MKFKQLLVAAVLSLFCLNASASAVICGKSDSTYGEAVADLNKQIPSGVTLSVVTFTIETGGSSVGTRYACVSAVGDTK